MFFHPQQIFDSLEIREEFRNIAEEAQNRNLSPQMVSRYFHSKDNPDQFALCCKSIYGIVKDKLNDDSVMDELIGASSKNGWQAMALFFGDVKGQCDRDLIATRICEFAVIKNCRTLDEYIESLADKKSYENLGIDVGDDGMADLSGGCFELKEFGILEGDKRLLYPHQFFRRGFRDALLGIPRLLMSALDGGVKIKMRIDPYRQTAPSRYFEYYELDRWYGLEFSKELLDNSNIVGRTVHFSTGVFDLGYDARFTVFRTMMMDAGIREFAIEEYCPLVLFDGTKSPGTGTNSCIQKFAHLCYDQNKRSFTHLDGAVRVFANDEYELMYKAIESGGDIGDKAGVRHKMFLVEGEIEMNNIQDILTEWFRMNPHIQEYFSGEKITPPIAYEKLEKLVAIK